MASVRERRKGRRGRNNSINNNREEDTNKTTGGETCKNKTTGHYLLDVLKLERLYMSHEIISHEESVLYFLI